MLFKSSDKVKEYAQLVGTIDMTSIKATLTFVEEQHIKPILGTELYNTLQAAYTAATNEAAITPASLIPLLEQVRKVTGPMLCYYYAPKADVQVSDSGVQRVETTSNKTAYQYQNTNFAQANRREAEANIESLIEFLEENKDDYSEWTASDAYTKQRSLFIKSGKEFNDLYTSHTPYRNYYAMRAKMYDVEEINIRELLGSTMFDALKVKDVAGTTSATEKLLLMRIKKAIAYLTVAFAIPMLNVRIDANGLSVMAFSSFSGNEKENTRSGADDNARTELMKTCTAAGQVWLKHTISFIKENDTDFANWKGFPLPDPNAQVCINTDLKQVFGLV